MKKLQKVGLGILALVLIAAFVFTGCDNGGGSSSPNRKPVADGRIVTSAEGNNLTTPIVVATTFSNNLIVQIAVESHAETASFFETIEKLLIPRILATQSIGVDSVAGATVSSQGVLSAIYDAITEAGGDPEEWLDTPKYDKNKAPVVFQGYDVIVIGLGGSGTTAYVKAAEDGAKVFGMEAAAKIGGNSVNTAGPMTANANIGPNPGNYTNIPELIKAWEEDFTDLDEYAGGPKMQMVKDFINESGYTVDWLKDNYSFTFGNPASFVMFGGPAAAGDTYAAYSGSKETMFTNAVKTAKAKSADNEYVLELRASKLTKNSDGSFTVEADYWDKTKYYISGKTVILATGGFIGNMDMMREYFNVPFGTEAVHTERGDGIRMATQGAGINAGVYNIHMPPMVHIAQIRNFIRTRDPAEIALGTNNWRQILTGLLLKGTNVLVGTNKPNNAAGKTGWGDAQSAEIPDLRGKRFTNEAASNAIAFDNWKAGGHYAAIYSNDVLHNWKTTNPGTLGSTMFMSQGAAGSVASGIPRMDDILAMGERTGNVYRAATLDLLARDLGVNAETLKETLETYNGYVDEASQAGTGSTDLEFGKARASTNMKITMEFPEGDLPYIRGYTAILGSGYYYGTCGGLDIDEDLTVLNTAKQRVEGLYAVGQDSMGVLFNAMKAYCTYGGAAQGFAITSGRIAGENAAALAKK